MKFKQFLLENEYLKEIEIMPSTKTNTLSLCHRGNLETSYEENKKQAKGRFEYAPGLYLTTSYEVVKKYTKGSRKLYMITIEKGIDLKNTNIKLIDAIEFVKNNIVKKAQKFIIEKFENFAKNNEIAGYRFNNILLNEGVITKANSDKLRQFYIDYGIDYSIEDNAFGWGERMIVLFNMRKIIDKVIVTSKDKIIEY